MYKYVVPLPIGWFCSIIWGKSTGRSVSRVRWYSKQLHNVPGYVTRQCKVITRWTKPAPASQTLMNIHRSWARRMAFPVFSTDKNCRISGKFMSRSARRNLKPERKGNILAFKNILPVSLDITYLVIGKSIVILSIYDANTYMIRKKKDHTPVTITLNYLVFMFLLRLKNRYILWVCTLLQTNIKLESIPPLPAHRIN